MVTTIPNILVPQEITQEALIAELAKLAKSTQNTEEATANLTSFEKKLYDYYGKYMRDHIHYIDDKFNEKLEKEAGDALERYAGHLYDQTSEGKKFKKALRARYYPMEQMIILEAPKRLAILEAAQKVTTLYQIQVTEAKAVLEPLGLKEVVDKSKAVLEYVEKRDKAYTEEARLLAEAQKIENKTMQKYARQEAHKVKLQAEMYENERAEAALEKIKATNKYRRNVQAAGKQKEYELVHGEVFNPEQIPERLVTYEDIQAQLYGKH